MSARSKAADTAEVHERLRGAFLKVIPSGQEIAARAVAKSLSEHGADVRWIKQHFSELVEQVQLDAYAEYSAAEQRFGGQVLGIGFLAACE
jgi:hypothetical protein